MKMALNLSFKNSALDGGREVLKTSTQAPPEVAGVFGGIPDPPPRVGPCPSAIYFSIY